MISEGTDDYWRRLLQIEAPLPAGFLEQFNYPHRLLRPLYYRLITLMFRHYCPVTVNGLDNLPAAPPYIIAANHASALDFAVAAWALGPRRREELYPLATKLFYDNPWTGFWIKVAAPAVRIDTVEDFFPALRTAVRVLKAGKAIYVNPEGQRATGGRILPFRAGVGVLAVETGVPLVPVYLHNTWKVLPTGKLWPRPNPVAVLFGQPVDPRPYREKLAAGPAYDVYAAVTGELQRRVIELSRSLC